MKSLSSKKFITILVFLGSNFILRAIDKLPDDLLYYSFIIIGIYLVGQSAVDALKKDDKTITIKK